MGQESVMLVVSEPTKFGDIPPSPIETWHISCCLCSPTRQYNDSVVVDSDLPKKLARRGIHLHTSASLVLYGSLSQQEEGRSVGPAVFFHSPVSLESHAIRLRVPVHGLKSSCDNCRVLPFIGTYNRNSLLYVFQSSQSKALIHYDRNKCGDPRHLVIAVKDTVIFRPSCISGPSPCCPTFQYQVCMYQSNPTEATSGQISVVVFVKSRPWEAVSVVPGVVCMVYGLDVLVLTICSANTICSYVLQSSNHAQLLDKRSAVHCAILHPSL